MAARKKPAKRKSPAKRKPAKTIAFPRKPIMIFVGALMFSWCCMWFFFSDADTRSAMWIKNKTIGATDSVGYEVDNILVEGRQHTDSAALLALLNTQKGDPIFRFDPHEARDKIMDLSWVQEARVERRLPDTIFIALTERTPIALWQNGRALHLVGDTSFVWQPADIEPFQSLPMIRGKGAPDQAAALFAILEAQGSLLPRLDHATYIDGRRWDLRLKNDKVINLPANDAARALSHVMRRNAEDRILEQDVISVIDARYKDRLIVRTRAGGVEDYKDAERESMLRDVAPATAKGTAL